MFNAVALVAEALETRVLLTTIVTTTDTPLTLTYASEQATVGDTSGHYVEISQAGVTTAEYVGAYLDENGVPQLSDLPGVFSNGTITDGGLQGGQGTQLLGQDAILDQVTGNSFPFNATGTSGLAIDAIGSDPGTLVPADKGIIYGLNFLTGTGTTPIIQLIEFPNADVPGASPLAPPGGFAPHAGNGNVIADLGFSVTQGLVDDPPASANVTPTPGIIGAVTAAAFNPINGLLYFIVVGGGADALPQLFSVNVHAGEGTGIIAANAAINATVNVIPGVFGARFPTPAAGRTPAIPGTIVSVSALTFDQTSPNTAVLDAFATVTSPVAGSQVQATVTTNEIADVSLANTNGLGNAVVVSLLSGVSPANITGIAIVNDDPTTVDQYVYAVTTAAGGTAGGAAGANAPISDTGLNSLIRIDRDSGASVVIASLVDPLTVAKPVLGADVEDLTFDPNIDDPITGLPGALVGTDAAATSLVVISSKIRPPSIYVFSIYVSQGDVNSVISIASPLDNDFDDPLAPSGDLSPFLEYSGDILVNDDVTGTIIPVTAPADTGYAYLGLKAGLTPITTAVETGSFGVLPASTSLTAGFTTAPGVDFGRFLFGGTVTGDITFGGTIDTFYAGWLITGITIGLLPGQIASGDSLTGTNDVQNIWVESDAGGGGIGGEDYNTGFTGTIAGHLGQFRVVDTLVGGIVVQDSVASNITSDQVKLVDQEGLFQDGFLGGDPQGALANNTFETPQYLGSLPSTDPSTAATGVPVVTVGGTLQGTAGDTVDYYGIALMAGQTITVQLQSEQNDLDVGVFDPDQRLIASDYSDDDGNGIYADQSTNKPFQITATMPGVYRFAVAFGGDTTFTGAVAAAADLTYLLIVGNIGDIALGGIYTDTFEGSAEVDNGDLGAIHADTSVGDTDVDAVLATAKTGNLRDVDAAATTVTVNVPIGGVGLLRSSVGVLEAFNDGFGLTGAMPVTGTAVGTEFQVVDAATTLLADLVANNDIGTIRAGNLATPSPSTFTVNPANNPAIAGKIDLIDCAGDFGTLDGGGPHITTGIGGDVGFINVGGTVYEDSFFGGGTPSTVLHNPGQAITVTDDGGANITLTPVGAVTVNPLYNASSPVAGVSPTLGPQLSLSTYGIRGSGGSVIVNVTVMGGSLDISSSGNAANGTAEVTAIDVEGPGTGVINSASSASAANSSGTTVVSPTSSPLLSTTIATGGTTAPSTNIDPIELDPAGTTSLTVTIEGISKFDVFDITGANFNSITNSTAGEIVDINAGSIGSLTSGGPIGVPTHVSAAQIDPLATLSNAFPFAQQHYGIAVSGDVVSVTSASAIGNLAVGGSIGLITPDSGRVKLPGGVFAGIDGPIVAGGQIDEVDIGQGILPSGTGALSRAGIYATGAIGLVTNSQPGAEIRGNIVSNVEINAIQLTNSSIINSVVDVIAGFSGSDVFRTDLTVPTVDQTIESPFFEVGAISLTGDGGIIGLELYAGNVGPITVAGGFGIFFSFISSSPNGVEAPVRASGYGIRGSIFFGGANLDSVSATGSGALSSTDLYDPAVFGSRTGETFDPYSGLIPSRLNDLDAYLGTSAATPNIPGVTDTGVIEDVDGIGSGDLGSLSAVTIREVTGQTPSLTTVLTPTPFQTGAFGTTFSFANSIGVVIARTAINGLELTTGHLGTFESPTVQRTGITISGIINDLVVHGNYGASSVSQITGVAAGDSFIQAVGPHGYIKSLTILGNLNASVLATAGIGNLKVTGNIVGNVTVTGTGKGLALGSLRIGGALESGTLNVTGSVGSIIANGGLGILSQALHISGNANLIEIGANRHLTGSALALSLFVAGTLRKLIAFGQITGTVQTGGDLGSLMVLGDGTVANIISGDITVGGRLLNSSIINGSISSSIIANGLINQFLINRGILDAGAVLQSNTSAIRSFRTLGGLNYGVNGQLLAANGLGDSVDISGSLGDGTNAAVITAASGTTFRIRGSISTNSTISVAHTLNLLQVDGGIAAGATISAHPLKKIKVVGINAGTITAV